MIVWTSDVVDGAPVNAGAPLAFNKREIIIPFFRVGVRALGDSGMQEIWSRFSDFRTVKG